MKDILEIISKDGKRLDQEQMRAVMCDSNCVVSAGAGSGKTTVLSYRFLRLVLQSKADCDQILTLTFTKKAAAEMNERIYLRLLSAEDDDQLKKFPDASISTLDSFFSQIVRMDCFNYALSDDFTIVDDDELKQVIKAIARRVFERYRGTPALTELTSLYAPEDIQDLVLQLSTKYFSLDRRIAPDSWYSEITMRLSEAKKKAAQNLERSADELLACLTDEENIKNTSKTIDLVNSDLDDKNRLEELSQIKIDGRKGKRNTGFSDKKERIEEFRKNQELYAASLVSVLNQSSIQGMLEILCEIQDEVLSHKRREGAVSFLDVSRMALDILKKNKNIRKYYKNKFKYIMIDEFQDNNSLQKDILFLLSERLDREADGVPKACELQKSKLFFVGDAKQSIYRFRGADVSVFKSLSDEIQSIGGEAINLDTNYRSTPLLIEQFNKVFNPLMGSNGQPYEADFQELGSREDLNPLPSHFRILYKPIPEQKDEQNANRTQAEMKSIADFIQNSIISSDEFLIPDEKGGSRRPQYSDIAILMRSMGKQNYLEKALRIADIPYYLQQPRALMQDAVANDICSVLQLCLFPEDKLAYAAVLSGPLCHLEGEDLKKALEVPPFEAAELSSQANLRYGNASRHYKALRQMVGSVDVSSLIDYIWFKWGYRYYLVTRKTSQSFIEHYDSLWILSRSFKSLSDFLSYARQLLGENGRLKDFDILREKTEGVKIMTIHKSKGLEFPIVIIADGSAGTKTDEDVYYECDDGLAVPRHIDYAFKNSSIKNLFFKSNRDLISCIDKAEQKRLLYVALTRAESHLIITGSQTRNSSANSFINMIADSIGFDLKTEKECMIPDTRIRFELIKDIPLTQTYLSADKIRPDAAEAYASTREWNNRDSYNRIAVTEFIRTPYEAGSGEYLGAIDSDKICDEKELSDKFGTFCHSILEISVRDGHVPDLSQALELLAAFDLSDSEKRVLAGDGLVFARKFIGSELFRKLSREKIQLELPFFCAGEDNGRRIAVEGKIDLLVATPECVMVLDYKTDRLFDPQVHRKQLEFYKQAIEKTTPLEVKCGLIYLRKPEEIHWL